MSDAPELLPCPFCGGEAEVDHRQPFWHYATGKTGYQTAIYCHDCTVNLTLCHDDHPGADPDDLMAELVAAWNRRAAFSDHPSVKALVAEAEARVWKEAIGLAISQTQWSPYTFGSSKNKGWVDGATHAVRTIEAALRAAAIRKGETT